MTKDEIAELETHALKNGLLYTDAFKDVDLSIISFSEAKKVVDCLIDLSSQTFKEAVKAGLI